MNISILVHCQVKSVSVLDLKMHDAIRERLKLECWNWIDSRFELKRAIVFQDKRSRLYQLSLSHLKRRKWLPFSHIKIQEKYSLYDTRNEFYDTWCVSHYNLLFLFLLHFFRFSSWGSLMKIASSLKKYQIEFEVSKFKTVLWKLCFSFTSIKLF